MPKYETCERCGGDRDLSRYYPSESDMDCHQCCASGDVIEPETEETFALERARFKEMPYPEYLKTDRWKAISSEIRARAQNRCEKCSTKSEKLNIHHLTYKRRGHELPEDLICLCSSCHQAFHDKEKAA